MSEIRYCKKCGEYTLEERCRACGNPTVIKKPARFSPQDRYARYRIALKKINRGGKHG